MLPLTPLSKIGIEDIPHPGHDRDGGNPDEEIHPALARGKVRPTVGLVKRGGASVLGRLSTAGRRDTTDRFRLQAPHPVLDHDCDRTVENIRTRTPVFASSAVHFVRDRVLLDQLPRDFVHQLSVVLGSHGNLSFVVIRRDRRFRE